MPDNVYENNPDGLTIQGKINELEARVSALEAKMGTVFVSDVSPVYSEQENDSILTAIDENDDESLIESKFGEFGLSWMGSIVLFLGFIFITEYIIRLGHPVISMVTGIILVSGMLVFSKFIGKDYSQLSFLFNLSGQVLLYYIILRLHFFTVNPVISSLSVSIILLLILIGVQYFFAIRKKSEFLTVVALILTFFTAIISDSTPFQLAMETLIAGGAVYLFYKFEWHKTLIFSIIIVYLSILIWMLSNPVMGHPLQAVATHQNSFFYIATCAVIYSLVPLIMKKGKYPESAILTSMILNGLGFSLLLFIEVTLFFPKNYVLLFTSITFFCIAYAVALKKFSDWKFSPALYVLFGFVALSVTIYGLNGIPRSFFLLSIQSLLVVSVALWFRSKIIVVMNFILYIFLLITYLVISGSIDWINFSFPVVAFISARIINWKKERLKIKTEMIRNIYLFFLFLTMLYACYKAFPLQYVTLSWTAVAIVYFLASLILHNMKYRWLALANMVATALNLFLVDLARLEIIYRIVAFLFLAIISLVLSSFYVRKLRKKVTQKKELN
ncbi:MAG: hypothetical protein NTX61_13160 [Bacteroidetes bacterium]|nr:hypothetical protein [Bacteroidota bacterium]